MFKKGLIVVSLLLLGFSVLKAQERFIKWEFLEISSVFEISQDQVSRDVRTYNYLTSGESFLGTTSLEWLKESGWEMISGGAGYYFKRRYSRLRTDREIARLKMEFDKEKPFINNPGLVDLDVVEAKQKLEEFNKAEESRLRAGLEKVGGLPLTIASVRSTAIRLGSPKVGASLILDGTRLLLHSKNNYRSSEVNKLMDDAAKQIFASLALLPDGRMNTNTVELAKNTRKPWRVDNFTCAYDGVNLMFSVVIVIDGKQNIVGQGTISGRWPTKQETFVPTSGTHSKS